MYVCWVWVSSLRGFTYRCVKYEERESVVILFWTVGFVIDHVSSLMVGEYDERDWGFCSLYLSRYPYLFVPSSHNIDMIE